MRPKNEFLVTYLASADNVANVNEAEVQPPPDNRPAAEIVGMAIYAGRISITPLHVEFATLLLHGIPN